MNTLRTFIALASPFWRSRQQWLAWLMLASLIGMGLLLVQINVLINAWSKTFYDTLGQFDTDALYGLMGQYAGYIAMYVLVTVYLDWLRKALVLRWRRAMTEHTVQAWFSDQAYYRMGLKHEPDNPDQRIAEDIDLLVRRSIELLVSFIANMAQVGAFVTILWSLSGVQQFTIGGHEFIVHGYLVWIAVAYTLLGTLITHFIGRPLKGLDYEQQRREADFRTGLMRNREHAEQIALYRGEAAEQQVLGERFTAIAQNWRRLMNRQRSLSFFTVSYDRVSLIIPVFAALPAFLAKTITLGGLMQIRSAFSAVQGSLSWFIQMYWRLAEWSATVERLGQFQQAIEANRPALRAEAHGDQLRIQHLDIHHPDGSPMLAGVHAHVKAGEWVRLQGRSGLGKSTLLRTLHGLWPYYRGHWQLPAGRSLLLPQQPYLPTLALRQLLAYPATDLPPDALLRQALGQVGLHALAADLDQCCEWPRQLSGGEQQRLSLARALVYCPSTLYLDEATSQLDEPTAAQLLALLRRALPQCRVVGITHQASLTTAFDREIELTRRQSATENRALV
ncbi:MAG: ABC transporter ATP-binding protein/permease [Pseudomonas sp.]|uniref:ABC transporter ATP-binding protein/permease n=1 Tax=Pseudomonas abieticivorans TaxID=2931382 RepID=UPI0020BFECA1|nr:ABC transporter ATP-binding protein/permease [Pseudomonas sp. PIA16]MDE1169142.1 ABC transporter ATP-binding protein/permease [Pseudomonas sp.]